ncbi:pectate lyase-like adhesive domain-containing protein, partial [Enterococcus plantarum]|uniref:pectate lyase-like adhesive domain-containing protein n=1 Tax=Enterococcus plantarum TaxID=1077675 RepID=UPI00114D2404
MKRKKTVFLLTSFIVVVSMYLSMSTSLIKADTPKEGNETLSLRQTVSEIAQPRMKNIEAYELTANGTGIVAKNIAKTMTDIQGYNGDIAAIKQMILKETGAKAYGLSGGSVVDVTDSIQVSDLKGLETVSSNDLQEFHLTLTVPATQSGTGSALSSDVIVYIGNVAKVSNWSQLDAAIRGNTATVIDIQNSFRNTSSSRLDILLNNTNRPSYVVLGNGYSVDFINYCYYWANNPMSKTITVDNLNMYGGNYYGPFSMTGTNALGSTVTYRNINYTGSQITASFQAIIRLEGVNNIKSKATTYQSFDGVVVSIVNPNQSGLESHTLIFAENSTTTIEVENGDGVILGSYMSDYAPVATIQPSLTMEKNATATIRTLGNGGETNSWGTAGGSLPSVISVQRSGKIDIGENAALNVETADGTTRVPVRLGYLSATSQWTTSINLEDSSNFNVTINGPISNTYSRAGFMLQQNSAINVGDNAEMVINANQMTTGAPVISMGQNAKFDVAQKGSLVLNKNGGTGRLLDLSTGSKFQVKDQGVTKFISTNEGASTSSMIYGGSGSSFIIGDKGTFESVIKDGTGVRNMLDFGSNTTFQFSNAQKIDLDSRGNTNVNLINMTNPGTFTADIQAVSAWSKADASQATPTFHWIPMYGMSIKYNGTTTTSVVGNSITSAIQKSFVDNYRTENFSRIVYDYIPDVLVGFDQPSDNKTLESGQKLTGTVNNNALMLFYLVTDESDPSTDILLTTPTVTSPIKGDARKFNTIADNNGKFTFDLPSSVTLKAGQKIKAYAWLDGKDSYALQTVADKTPPEGESVNYQVALNSPTPPADKFVKNPTDSNPTPQNFTYAFNAETPQSMVDGFMSQIGEHTVKVDLFDEAGNGTTIVSKLTVNKVIDGSDFNAPYKDIRDLSDDQLKSYILEHSQPRAYKISDGQKTDISSLIKITDFGGLNETENLRPKAYPVTLTIKAADSGLAT